MIKMGLLLAIGIILLIISKKVNLTEKLFGFHESCYTEREYAGDAAMGCCGGMVSGTSATNCLSEMCVSCPHLVLTK